MSHGRLSPALVWFLYFECRGCGPRDCEFLVWAVCRLPGVGVRGMKGGSSEKRMLSRVDGTSFHGHVKR